MKKMITTGIVVALACVGCVTQEPPHHSEFMTAVLEQLDLVQPGCDCQVTELPMCDRVPAVLNPEVAILDWPNGHHFRVVTDPVTKQFWVERTIGTKTEIFGPGNLREE